MTWRVRAPASLVVVPDPAFSGPPDHCERFPEVFSAGVVTHSMSCAVPPGRDKDVSAEVLASI